MKGRALFIWVTTWLVVLCAFSRRGEAYPQFQFTTGNQRCADCHFAPAGGGLINEWGRQEAGNTISMMGDGGFLHGLWTPPRWLALGGDFRDAFIRSDVGGAASPEYAVFPMMAEVYVRGEIPNTGLSLYATGGYRGTVRSQETTGITRQIEAFISREHYLMWKPREGTTPYLRIGRFYSPYGLRLVEHVYYVRRYSGYNLYEETYNLSGGYLHQDWEVHATASTSPPAGFPKALGSSGLHGTGATLYGEKRFASMAALGVQGRVTVNEEQTFSRGGGIGKLWVEQAKLLFMGELDLGHRAVKTGGESATQLVSYLGATVIPIRGLMAGVAHERYHEDLHISGTVRNAFDLQINFFPVAHIEFIALGRYQLVGSGKSDGQPSTLAMLQFHYFL